MIDDTKRYEFVTKQIDYHNDKIIEALTLFVQVWTAIVGGVVWLSLQSGADTIKAKVGPAIPWVFALVGIVTILLIVVNVLSWWGYRKAESALVGNDKVPPPQIPRSLLVEAIMIIVILVFSIGAAVVLRI